MRAVRCAFGHGGCNFVKEIEVRTEERTGGYLGITGDEGRSKLR